MKGQRHNSYPFTSALRLPNIRGSFHKQVTKQHNFGNFQSMKNPNIIYVLYGILCWVPAVSFITMTSLWRHLSTLKVSRNEQYSVTVFVFRGQKPAHMPLFPLNCVQCIVTSVLRNQQYIAWCNKFTNSPNTEFCKKVSKYVAKQNVDFYSASTS